VRIAVLADIHGNAPALRTVLAEIDRQPVQAIVVAGDLAGGPLVRASLELLRARPEPVHWVSGNSERETVAAYDGVPQSDGPAGLAARWSAGQLDAAWRDELASWPIALSLDDVLFCHGSPRKDDEILTTATPDDVFAEALDGVSERLVVGGHTHRQFIRTIRDDLVYANAGSVGLPYEGRRGAFWMTVDDGTPELRHSDYDVPAALEEMRAAGHPFDDLFQESVIEPADPDSVAEFFERRARPS
jgi:predicted phosphodiesterase